MELFMRQNSFRTVFIDGNSLYQVTKRESDGRAPLPETINYKRLRNLFQNEKTFRDPQPARLEYYTIQREGDEKHSGFTHLLASLGIAINKKVIPARDESRRPSRPEDTSIEMTLDVIRAADQFESIVLVTNQRRFIPVIKDAKARGCYVTLAFFGGAVPHDLMAAADQFMDLGEHVGQGFRIDQPEPREEREHHNQVPVAVGGDDVAEDDDAEYGDE